MKRVHLDWLVCACSRQERPQFPSGRLGVELSTGFGGHAATRAAHECYQPVAQTFELQPRSTAHSVQGKADFPLRVPAICCLSDLQSAHRSQQTQGIARFL